MILGVGIDLVEVERIKNSLDHFGDRFLKRILRTAEIAYCRNHEQRLALHVAARFAAKEAIAKAFGTGLGAQLGWQDMEVGHRDTGEPSVLLHGAGQTLLAQRAATRVWLSLSHTAGYAIAVAILERD